MKKFDFVVIGGGIVGTATAYKLSKKFPDSSIALIEKEKRLASHQTGRNSGVIHSGIYYKPGSLKAENCRNGREQLVEFADRHNLNFRVCGKIIVATRESELPILEKIYSNGMENKTPGIVYLNSDEISAREPYIRGVKGVYVPVAGIIDFVETSEKFMELTLGVNKENELLLEEEVKRIDRIDGHVVIKTNNQQILASKVIICGGLQADRLAQLDGLSLSMQIVGFRGDYYELKPHVRDRIKNLVYPVPDPRYPFLGVHYTPMVDGRVECGPNAVFTFKREGYSRTSFNLKDSLQAVSFRGTYRLFAKNWLKGLEEYRRAFSKRLFVKELQQMMPSITQEDVEATRSGVRAMAVDVNGEMIDDFKIVKNKGVIHVLNAPSPAATACMSIADEIVEEVID